MNPSKYQKNRILVELSIALFYMVFSSLYVRIDPPFILLSDFVKAPKIDAHFHYNTTDIRYLKFADSLNMRLVSPNVDTRNTDR